MILNHGIKELFLQLGAEHLKSSKNTETTTPNPRGVAKGGFEVEQQKQMRRISRTSFCPRGQCHPPILT